MTVRTAVLTTAPAVPSAVGERVRRWLPRLRERLEIVEFVEPGRESTGWCGETSRAASELRVRDFDQVLYLVGNEAAHAFMLPILRALGGVVVQHDWPLVALAAAARPDLLRRGMRGTIAALREGGLREARAYRTAAREPEDECWPARLEHAQLTLNRSVVRHADSFIVASEAVRSAILIDRNSATPIGVVPGIAAQLLEDDGIELVALELAGHLARFPPPRSRRRSLLHSAIAASRRDAQDSSV